ELRPDVIFNCTGLTYRRPESVSYSAHVRINSVLPHTLNEWCVKNGSRLIGLSTDCVFSGKDGNYTETSNPDARDA
ncbi:MAG: sugar nucleotide-binding protein, partial [Bdellovibrionota bacterium]